MQRLSNRSTEIIAPNLTNPGCGATSGLPAIQNFNGQIFLGTSSSDPLPSDTIITDSHVVNWCPWDLRVDQPIAQSNGVCQHPDTNIQRPEFDRCYSTHAKHKRRCGVLQWAARKFSNLHTERVSEATKSVCPEAYNYSKSNHSSINFG